MRMLGISSDFGIDRDTIHFNEREGRADIIVQ